jgi:ribosomal protein S21
MLVEKNVMKKVEKGECKPIRGIVVRRDEFNMADHSVVVEKMIKKFTKLCAKEEVISECLKRKAYEKPSVKRRRKIKENANKRKIEEKRKNRIGGGQ